jgi:flagellar biosynthesis protein FlhF
MEMFVEQGSNRMDCEMKIMEKYKRPFHIFREKKIRIGGILGFFSKPGVEVEFYFSPIIYKTPLSQGYQGNTPVSWQVSDTQQRHYLGEQVSRNNTLDFEEVKRKIITAAGPPPQTVLNGGEESRQILESLKEIKEKIETGILREEHPAFARAEEFFKLNDFSEKFTRGMLERMRKELPLETLDNKDAVEERLLEWIGGSINIYKEEEKQGKGNIMILVGPTGVGKTTTIAKLAKVYGIGNSETQSVNVRMITIDAFRIGARQQLEPYGDIMEIPVSYIDNKHDLRKEITIHAKETDLFLVDTFGNSPKDSKMLGVMKEILDGCGRKAQTHLVFSAITKTSDIEDILRQFEPFNYRSVVLTKMDETNHFGNVISALAEKNKPVSYITDGQEAHKYIRKATVAYFLVNLDDIKADRDKIEKRFPSGEADMFR